MFEEKWTFEEMEAALKIKWKNRTCECCGSQEWVMSERIMEHSFPNPLYHTHHTQCFTSIIVACEHCGNMKNFRTKYLFH